MGMTRLWLIMAGIILLIGLIACPVLNVAVEVTPRRARGHAGVQFQVMQYHPPPRLLQLRGGSDHGCEEGEASTGTVPQAEGIVDNISKMSLMHDAGGGGQKGEVEMQIEKLTDDEQRRRMEIREAAQSITKAARELNEKLDAEGVLNDLGGDTIAMPMDTDTDEDGGPSLEEEYVNAPAAIQAPPGVEGDEARVDNSAESNDDALLDDDDDDDEVEEEGEEEEVEGMTKEELDEMYGGKDMRRYRKQIRGVMKMFNMKGVDEFALEGEDKKLLDSVQHDLAPVIEFGNLPSLQDCSLPATHTNAPLRRLEKQMLHQLEKKMLHQCSTSPTTTVPLHSTCARTRLSGTAGSARRYL